MQNHLVKEIKRDKNYKDESQENNQQFNQLVSSESDDHSKSH